MPVSEAAMPVFVPLALMEPMLLLLMVTSPLLSEAMPKVMPPAPEVKIETDPVPVGLPMVLPGNVPMFTAPVST